MVKTGVSVAGRLALFAVLAASLHGCMLDPAGLAMSAADMAYSPGAAEPIDLTADYKDMYRAQSCEQLAALDNLHRQTPVQPGAQANSLQLLEALRQLNVEKGCPAVAVASIPTPTPTPAAVAASAPVGSTPAVTSANRGWLGASLLEGAGLPAALSRDLGLVGGHGVLVIGVAPGSAAAQAGLKVADVIQSVDGTAFDQTALLIAALAARKPGDGVALQVWRNHASLPLKATLAYTPSQFPGGDAGTSVYCYVQTVPSLPVEGGAIYWLTQPFAVSGATLQNLRDTSQRVGQQFKDYLLSQGVSATSLKASLGICSTGYAQSANSLKLTLEARKGGEFAALGATNVTVYWQP